MTIGDHRYHRLKLRERERETYRGAISTDNHNNRQLVGRLGDEKEKRRKRLKGVKGGGVKPYF